MKKLKFTLLAVAALLACCTLASCSDDNDNGKKEPENAEHDTALLGEWIETDGSNYIHRYLAFYSDGTGTSGIYESDIEWVDEDDDFHWYTIDDKYLYMDGSKYEYDCYGSTLELNYPSGKTVYFHEL